MTTLNIERCRGLIALRDLKDIKSADNCNCPTWNYLSKTEVCDQLEAALAEIEALRAKCEERGRRMSLLRKDMRLVEWMDFIRFNPEATEWFNNAGEAK